MQDNVNIPDSTITSELTFRNLVLMNMQQLTNFPYIEKDFDALTDYELLCLVVKYLNDVIDNQNEQNDSITNMYNAFLALQTYVNNTKDTLEDAFNTLDDYVRNYFANLDVQDEINNKLDQMLEDGVLEQIIEQFLQSTAVWCFDTVADMKLATNLINGSFTQTLGFHSINDGGKSLYKVRTLTNDDVVDEMTIISLYDELLVAELMEKDEVNVKQLGAYGDNTHDDLLPIQAAINKFKVVYVPYGNYHITDGLTCSKDVIIKGDSKLSIPPLGSFINMTKENTTLLECDNDAVHVELDSIGFTSTSCNVTVDASLSTRPSEPYNPYHYNETVAGCNGILTTKKLKITNCYFTGFSGYAINANANALITDVWISHSNVGIRVNGYDPIITRPYITLCNEGISMLQSVSSSIFMYDIWIDQIVTYGIHAKSGIVGIINGEIDHIGYSGIYSESNCKINLDMRIGRCGMYYAGTAPASISNENMIYACSMYLTNILDSQIKVTYEYRDIGTSTGTTSYMLPKCVLCVKQYIRSLLYCIENEDVELIRVINYANSNGSIITQNGIKKWNSTSRQFEDIYTLNT